MPLIIKGDGERQEFKIEKLVRSLEHAGADADLSERIAEEIREGVIEGMTTTEIYKKAFQLLHKHEHVAAARYSMRRAILDLGPTGFPFEDYVSELFRAQGYETAARVVVQGRCIEHEVDVVMKKDGHTAGAELKFHNTPGLKTDVKIVLYVRARYWDIQWGAEDRKERGIDEGILITNTKFTTSAERYAQCCGIRLIGWNYPYGAGLADMIKNTGVYPVTVLTTLSRAEKIRLMAEGVALCHDILRKPGAVEMLGLSSGKLESVLAETKAVCLT
ncbi:MAG: restriction endonuclease [Patescibacteria group bacterium]|nr:restriction endonuclease [Patescibacteria group bacterium]